MQSDTFEDTVGATPRHKFASPEIPEEEIRAAPGFDSLSDLRDHLILNLHQVRDAGFRRTALLSFLK